MDAKTYIDERIKSLEESMKLRFEAANGASAKAERLLEARLEGLNEWREENRQQTARHATKQDLSSNIDILRAEYDGRLKVLEAILISLILLIIGEFLLPIIQGG